MRHLPFAFAWAAPTRLCSCCAPVVLVFVVLVLCSAAAGGASACLYNYIDRSGQGRQAECEAPNVPHAGLKVMVTMTKILRRMLPIVSCITATSELHTILYKPLAGLHVFFVTLG